MLSNGEQNSCTCYKDLLHMILSTDICGVPGGFVLIVQSDSSKRNNTNSIAPLNTAGGACPLNQPIITLSERKKINAFLIL